MPVEGLRYDVSVERTGCVCSDDDTLTLWYLLLIFVHLSVLETNTLFRKIGFFFFSSSGEMNGWRLENSV